MSNITSFSIENKIYSGTQQPFGSKYGGTFSVRRPSLQDRNMADIRKSALLNAYGAANLDSVGDWTKTSTYIWCLVNIISTEKLPEWFDLSKIYDEQDEDAMLAVWEELGQFLNTFRQKTDSGTGQ